MTCEMAGFSDAALLELFERHRNELRLDCYRMLGSSLDADDMLQEAALRAKRASRWRLAFVAMIFRPILSTEELP